MSTPDRTYTAGELAVDESVAEQAIRPERSQDFGEVPNLSSTIPFPWPITTP